MHYDHIDRGNVEQMVRAFYAQALADKMIGPTFIRKLGNDMRSPAWFEHLKTVDKFWYTIMTGEHGYRGHPFPPHMSLQPLTNKMLAQWLTLFRETLNHYYIPELANLFYLKAEEFAEEFREMLSLDEEEDEE